MCFRSVDVLSLSCFAFAVWWSCYAAVYRFAMELHLGCCISLWEPLAQMHSAALERGGFHL